MNDTQIPAAKSKPTRKSKANSQIRKGVKTRSMSLRRTETEDEDKKSKKPKKEKKSVEV